MKTTKFLTILGDEIEIQSWLLSRREVTKAAEEFFDCKVLCNPCVYGHNTVGVGWRCINSETGKVVGYLSLTTGIFCRTEDYDYPINISVPIGKSATKIYGNEICYTGLSLAIYKAF